ncbi:MAG: hypothetical protein J7L23_03590 [Candidatus Diapherotrites archaeon]|nr:hypothetical protein [Candidatus Diapherotrites archaeon]
MKRERITITLSKQLLDRIDSIIDGSNIRNRSHAIESLVEKSIGSTVSSALIISGDRKIRIHPLARRIPKLLTPVKKKTLAEHMINWMRENGLVRIIVGAGYKKDKISEQLGDGSKWKVNITYANGAGKVPGDMDYLLGAREQLMGGRFVLVEGDVATQLNLKGMLDFHERNNALVTIAVKSVPKPVSDVVELEGFRVVDIKQKPGKEFKSNLVYAGVCIMEPKVFDYLGNKPAKKDFLSLVASEGELYGYPFTSPWVRILNVNDVKLAEKVF